MESGEIMTVMLCSWLLQTNEKHKWASLCYNTLLFESFQLHCANQI